jgi:hypothetical protein
MLEHLYTYVRLLISVMCVIVVVVLFNRMLLLSHPKASNSSKTSYPTKDAIASALHGVVTSIKVGVHFSIHNLKFNTYQIVQRTPACPGI